MFYIIFNYRWEEYTSSIAYAEINFAKQNMYIDNSASGNFNFVPLA